MAEKPILKIRSGAIFLAAWKNRGEKGTWFSIKLEKRYKDGNEWKSTSNLSDRDLLEAARLLEVAHDYLRIHVSAEGRETPPVGYEAPGQPAKRESDDDPPVW